MNEPYGEFIGTVTLPEEYRLGLVPRAETGFPWKWLNIGGLIIALFICTSKK